MAVRVLIEGRAARDAAEDLVGMPGLRADLETVPEGEPQKDPFTLAAVVAIVGVVGGVATLADQIMRWCDRWRASRDDDERSVERIVLVIENHRRVLDGVSAEELSRLLDRTFGSAD